MTVPVTSYVPILGGKAAEYEALAKLPDQVLDRTVPLIEITPLSLDNQTEQPTKTVETHLVRDASALMQCWGYERPIYVDALNVADSRTAAGMHPVVYLHDQLKNVYQVRAIPVISLDRDNEYRRAVASAVLIGGLGLCVRLDRNQTADPNQLAADLFPLEMELEVSPEDIDILIDLGAVGEDDAASTLTLARGALQALPSINEWRSVIVAASSFPATVGEVAKLNQEVVVRRAEWEMFEMLAGGIASLPRLPAFGDYGIEGAAGSAAPPPMVTWNRMSASIRYTGLGGWFIVRGDMMNAGGNQQFHKLAATIEHSAHWKGRDYSWGDGYLYLCAHHGAKPGTHKKWRAVGVNHHITQVIEEVSTLLGP